MAENWWTNLIKSIHTDRLSKLIRSTKQNSYCLDILSAYANHLTLPSSIVMLSGHESVISVTCHNSASLSAGIFIIHICGGQLPVCGVLISLPLLVDMLQQH